ncbi:hypothetical protein [Pseudomonas putida]|jgi:hypothetical protein|uniref:hypothetical protein n=1 Tax=Pseudomonas putida TaxID=303 RepID=UPI0023642969|nr:hypothetical protein [Pseudomonas putida]MDD2098832.1 hypothetical protein [Pseudomonas putida]
MSGWQRLGVVLSVVVAVIIIADNYQSFPTQKRAYWEVSNRLSLWAPCEKYYEDKDAGRKNSNEYCSSYPKQQVIEKIRTEAAWYRDQLKTMTERQVKFVAYHFAWWAGLTLIMYVIATVMKWVYRGFRPKKA